MSEENLAAESAADDSEFNAAFAEFAGGSEEPTESGEVEESGNDDSGYETEAEVQDETATQDEVNGDSESLIQQAGESDQDFAARFEAAEKAAKTWEHKYKSEVGRQTALQRQVNELKAQLQSQPESKQAQRQYSARMQKLMDEFPEIGEAFNGELQEQLAAVRNEVSQFVEPMRQQEQERIYQQEEARVKELYPDFAEIVKTPQFSDWFNAQPEAVKSLAASPYANDAVAVMDYYSAYSSRHQAAVNPVVQQVQAKRNEALQRHVSVRNTAPSPVNDGPDSFESAFEYYSRKKERAR